MDTIIIICNDPRVEVVKEAFQPLLVAKIGIVPDFDTGLKEVFEKRPLVVFIQDEIASVRGETVTRHIRSLLQANSPHFVQLDRTSAGPHRTAGSTINLNIPDEELAAQFKAQLELVPGIHWKDDVTKMPEDAVPHRVPPADSGDDTFTFFTDDGSPAPTEPPREHVSETAGGHPDLPRPAGELLNSPAVPSPPAAAAAAVRPVETSRPEKAVSSPVSVPESTPAGAGDGAGEVPFPVEPAMPGRRSMAPILIGCAVLILLGGALLYRFSPHLFAPATPAPQTQSGSAPPKRPIPAAATQQKGSSGAIRPRTLPSFIPQEGLDGSYGQSKPGWERYVSPQREYLLFREAGRVRALQIIALQEGAIDDTVVATVLRELCGAASCAITSRTSRDGYQMEQGEIAGKAEVIFYKKKGTGETRGVVVSLP